MHRGTQVALVLPFSIMGVRQKMKERPVLTAVLVAAIGGAATILAALVSGGDGAPKITAGRDNVSIGEVNVGRVGDDTLNLNNYVHNYFQNAPSAAPSSSEEASSQKRPGEAGPRSGTNIDVKPLMPAGDPAPSQHDESKRANQPTGQKAPPQVESKVNDERNDAERVTVVRIDGTNKNVGGRSFDEHLTERVEVGDSVTATLGPVAAGAIAGDVTGSGGASGTLRDNSPAMNWSIDEPGCGTISSEGIYTEPPPPHGPLVCHVRATSSRDPAHTAVVELAVSAAE